MGFSLRRPSNSGWRRSSGGMLGEDHVFDLTRTFGRRLLDVANIPPGWFVKSIKYDGKDITDVATEFKASRDPSALEIVLSTRGAVVLGRVFDERGEPALAARVLIFPVNPALGHARGSERESLQQRARSGSDLSAPVTISSWRSHVEPAPEFEDRERMVRLVDAAERVALTHQEERTIDLRIEKIPEPAEFALSIDTCSR